MKKIRLAVVFMFTMFIMGCDGCFNEELIEDSVQPPSFSLNRGTNYTVNITSGTEGATVKYTINGNDPVTGDGAVIGNSVTIDYFTEIKAYAFKDDMLPSCVVSYKLPTFNRTTNVRYGADMNVDYYSYSELDGNENKKIEVFLNDKGSDGTWFTEDDTVYEYHLFQYDSTGLTRENVYTDPGTAGIWLTDDDVLDSYYLYEYDTAGLLLNKKLYSNLNEILNTWTYEYNASSQLSCARKYNETNVLLEILAYEYSGDDLTLISSQDPADTDPLDGITLLEYTELAYLNGKFDSATKRDANDAIIAYSKYSYDNIKEYTEFTYEDGVLQSETKYKGYGKDTQFAITEYVYTEGKLASKTEYDDINKISCKSFIEYSYNEDESLNAEDYFSSPSKEEKLYSYCYVYEEGVLTQKEKYDSDGASLLEYTSYSYDEDGKKTRETLYMQPDPNYFTITFNLTVNAGLVDGGYFASGGVNYTYEGVPATDIIDIGSDQAEMIQNIITQLRNIYDNYEMTDNGVLISGAESGNALITVSVVDNIITVNFDFQSFNNGDITIDGEVEQILEGTFNIEGEPSGTLDGEMSGTLIITDADPLWSNDQYLINAVTVFEYDPATDLLSTEKHYADAGPDGEWDTADDNQESLKEYYYNASLMISEIRFYKGTGPASKSKCSVVEEAEEITDYRLVFIYDGDLKTRVDKFCEYGTYIETYSEEGGVFDHSLLEFSE